MLEITTPNKDLQIKLLTWSVGDPKESLHYLIQAKQDTEILDIIKAQMIPSRAQMLEME